jgi:hypothetical protein
MGLGSAAHHFVLRCPRDTKSVYDRAMFPPERIVCLTEETVETL